MSARTLVFIFCATIVVACNEPNPRDHLIGLWEGERDYVFVNQDRDRTVYTSIDSLRGAVWSIPKDPAGNPVASAIHLQGNHGHPVATIELRNRAKPGFDSMIITPVAGGPFTLHRRALAEESGLLTSSSSYTRGWYFLGVIHPDGVFRLLFLYVLAMALATLLIGPWALLPAIGPVLVGYGFGIVRWVADGWWDPFGVGRVMVQAAIPALLLAPLCIVYQGRTIKEGELARLSPDTRRLLLGVFAVADLVSILTTVGVLLEWLE